MDKKLKFVGFRTVSKRGGSLSITLDVSLARKLDVKAGDSVALFFDEENKRIIIEKISEFTTSSGLAFSLSRGLAERLLRKKKKNEK